MLSITSKSTDRQILEVFILNRFQTVLKLSDEKALHEIGNALMHNDVEKIRTAIINLKGVN